MRLNKNLIFTKSLFLFKFSLSTTILYYIHYYISVVYTTPISTKISSIALIRRGFNVRNLSFQILLVHYGPLWRNVQVQEKDNDGNDS